MSQRQVQGHQELLDDAARTRALAISTGTIEERLHGLSPEDRLRGLSAADRARLRELLEQEDRPRKSR